MDKFKQKNLAKFAVAYLKRMKKLSLLNNCKNIKLQLKLTQLRFLVNLKYDTHNAEPISEDSWTELVLVCLRTFYNKTANNRLSTWSFKIRVSYKFKSNYEWSQLEFNIFDLEGHFTNYFDFNYTLAQCSGFIFQRKSNFLWIYSLNFLSIWCIWGCCK